MQEQEGLGNTPNENPDEATGDILKELSEETLAVYQPLTLDDIRNASRHRRE